MILILADEFDTHADAVQKELDVRGANAVRLNLNVEALKKTRVAFDGMLWSVCLEGASFFSRDVRAVWARRLTVSETLEQQHEPLTTSKKLWRSEWNRALFGLYASLRHASWINPVQAATLAENKFHQMAVAQAVGFVIPRTIMSNDRDFLQAFAQRCGSVALKFLSQEIYQLDDNSFAGIYVNKISDEDLLGFGDESENPIVLQQYVNKAFEVRYTVVDKSHFVCAIHSQESERASIDWRRYDIPNTPHLEITPPPQIRTRVELLMNCLELRYGALDFIVDATGEWHFLEVNTAGQWLWIEDLVGLPISASLAEALATG